ncbi:4-fold beta flower protein [Azotosporobacter soli]|uniref:4-fold beta flower protein n=1 Tax=Azotosporobacter soli TaxID=3055040 RepID=UPI0031FED1A6
MIAIFDRRGVVRAWLDKEYVYNLEGSKVLGFLDNEGVFNVHGEPLGFFSTGFFRDKSGFVVAFIDSALGGPRLPERQQEPFSPLGVVPPLTPLPTRLSAVPGPRADWSSLDWRDFIRD